MLGNASPLEVGWTVTAFFGVIPWTLLLFRALALELRRHRAGPQDAALEAALHKDIATASGQLVVVGCFLVAGLVSMQSPPSPLAATDPSAAVAPVLVPLLFMFANATATVAGGYGLLKQHELDHELRAALRRDRRATDRVEP